MSDEANTETDPQSWRNVEEVVANFSLRADPSNQEGVLDELRRLLAAKHPDRTGGSFPSADAEDAFHAVSGAIRFVEGVQMSRALVLSKRLADLELALRNQGRELAAHHEQENRREILVDSRADLRRAYRAPLLTAATAFCCSSVLLAFIKTLKDIPALSFLLQGSSRYLLVTIWALSGLMSIMLWLRERLTNRQMNDLLTDEALVSCFRSACYHVVRSGGTSITPQELLDQLPGENRRWPMKLRLRNLKYWRLWVSQRFGIRLSQDRRERVVTSYVERLLHRGAIELSRTPDIVQNFEIVASVREKYSQ
jgi:hypothetical protein